jgi:hypothetical protein
MAQPKMSDVIELARYTINDTDADAYRDDDAALLKLANAGLDDFFQLRPDLFIGSLASAGATEGHQLTLGNDMPIDGRWKRLLADYVIAHAEFKDDEHAVSGRAAAFMKQLERRLQG